MKFNKHHKVILSSMNREDAKDFIKFLQREQQRHAVAILDAYKEKIWGYAEGRLAYVEFWQSAIIRHQEDLAGIFKLIERVKKRFNLE